MLKCIMDFWKYTFLFSFYLYLIKARKHHLIVKNDSRSLIPITRFGFFEKGVLQVDVDSFQIFPHKYDSKKPVGFRLKRIINPYSDQDSSRCELEQSNDRSEALNQITFVFDFQTNRLKLNCSESMKKILIFNHTKQITFEDHNKKNVADSQLFRSKNPTESENNISASKENLKAMDSDDGEDNVTLESSAMKCVDTVLHMTKNRDGSYNFSFAMYIARTSEEGLYYLSFHNCYNFRNKYATTVSMILKVEEKNANNYLSAGKIPLPALYFMMSLLFILSACFWFFILKNSKEPVFKIHYLMGVLVVIKALSLLFHAINYHFIQVKGEHMEAWAVMYYIMHLLKGALLFIVLALIGSGWAFIKCVLTSKEKKIFAVVIPLQIIANVATIIIEETEESDPDRIKWMQLLFLIDFLCCVAILLPVVWSIRHLQEASQTDGKAAVSLSKLKLFRHFYVMVVCYIYFTRIIVYLLQITVTFQYVWLDDMFREMATFVFFVMTGYKFRPATNNPYFYLEADDEDMDTCLTTTGLTENLTKVNRKDNKKKGERIALEIYENDEEVNLLNVHESSHELD